MWHLDSLSMGLCRQLAGSACLATHLLYCTEIALCNFIVPDKPGPLLLGEESPAEEQPEFHLTYGWFHPGRRMTPKKWHYFFLRQNLYFTKYKYWRVTANL